MTPTPDPSVTDWIVAITSAGTLLAAVAAGVFAQRAAHWTKRQAESASDDLQVSRDALEVARQEARDAHDVGEHQRQEAARSARRLAESRVDALMPTVYARARPAEDPMGNPAVLEVAWPASTGSKPYPDWQPVKELLELGDSQAAATFRISLVVDVTNHSQQIAQVDILDPGHGEVSRPSGSAILLLPGETKSFTWRRVLSSSALRTPEDLSRPDVWLMDAKLWVRDFGLNAHDVAIFNASFPLFTRDGSRLLVKAQSELPWTENVAQPMPERVYDRLDALEAGPLPNE